jgi:uncharacterized protein YerC
MKTSEKQKIRKYAKKLKCINYLGGSCIKCGESSFFKLAFHHKNPNEKEFNFGNKINIRWSKLKDELDKCDLLCQNCHRELHYSLDNLDNRRGDKRIYLEYTGSQCVKCGYNECPAALTFHHRNPEEKEFWIGGLSERINSVYELDERIKNELDKCDLLCANCHSFEHSDYNFFEKNKNIIEIKSDNIKEIQSKIDRKEVYRMLDSGIKQSEIAKYFNASNGTISDIKKERNNLS